MAAQKFNPDSNPTIRTWTVQGMNEDDGGDEVATVILEANSAFREPDDDTEYRYHIYYFLDGNSEDQINFIGCDDRREANDLAEHLVQTLEDEYVERGMRLRQERAIDLRDLVSDWSYGPDRVLIEMVADLIESGQADALLNQALTEIIDDMGGDHVTAN